jgi:MFS superfamily sulfate permease-like transporter
VLSVGLANIASGITGGIPATAALARTSLNVKSGATSRGAGIMNGISIILLSTVLFSAFKFLPLPIVAAILVNTAIRLVEWHEVRLLMETDKPMAVVMVVTAIICIIEDPTMGII